MLERKKEAARCLGHAASRRRVRSRLRELGRRLGADRVREGKQARGWGCQLGQLAWVSPWAMLGQNLGLVDGFTWAYFQRNGLG